VDFPKVYDDSALDALLQAAQKNLASLNAFDSGTLIKGLGTLQGSSAIQSQNALQATTTGTATTPTVPTVPSLSAFTLPTTFSPSSVDLLNEETQLGFQIVSLQLLLQGARSDQVVPRTNYPKTRVTLGFPVSINVPAGYQYQEAVAEVEVSVCASEDSQAAQPSLITILPQAKTYNVASLVSKSTQVSGGAIAGVMNVGGSFLRGKQTYYLLQDQDTIAFQRPPHDYCNSLQLGKDGKPETKKYRPVTFGWQFKPVLGEKVIRDGLRQTFVQLSFRPALEAGAEGRAISCGDSIHVRAGWRSFDKRTGRVGARIAEFKDLTEYQPEFDNPPTPLGVKAEDNGDGTLTVLAYGGFKVGTSVRIGNLVLGPANSIPQPSAPGGNSPSAVSQPANPGANPSGNTVTTNPGNAAPVSNTPTTTPTPATGTTPVVSQNTNTPAAAAGTQNPTTLQIQATLQIPGTLPTTITPSAPITPSPGGGTAATGFLFTSQYIKFIAPASAIALNGAFLVNPDGTEAPVLAGQIPQPLLSCESVTKAYEAWQEQEKSGSPVPDHSDLRVPGKPAEAEPSDLVMPPTIRPDEPAEANLPPLEPGIVVMTPAGEPDSQQPPKPQNPVTPVQKVQTTPTIPLPASISRQLKAFSTLVSSVVAATTATAAEIKITPYSDSLSTVTLSNLPEFSNPDSRVPDVPIVLIGSTVFGLRDQPFTSLDTVKKEVSLLVPNALLRDQAKSLNKIVWQQLFAPDSAGGTSEVRKVYAIPRNSTGGASPQEAAVCAISSPPGVTFLSTSGAGSTATNKYAVFGTRLETLKALTGDIVRVDDPARTTMRTLTIATNDAKNAQNIVLVCDQTPLSLALPQPIAPSGASNPKETVSTTAPTVSLRATTIQVSGTGLDHAVDVRYGGKSLQFVPTPPGDGTGLTIIQLAPNDPFNPASTAGPKSVLVIFADQTSAVYPFKVQ
jgi:hypothetical protein